MYKITCFNCKQSWTLNSDAIAAALASVEPGQTHYTVECPRCRRINKISVKQLKRALPPTPPAQEAEEQS
ncbi:MAG: hypothetical protein Kow00124_22610 [Anaerolineae bacterium]